MWVASTTGSTKVLSASSVSFCKYFEAFGAVNECRLVCDKVTKRSRGFGFVTYIDRAVAEAVLSKRHSINGSNVTDT